MSKVLNVDEMLECAEAAGVLDYEMHLANLEASASLLAKAIARRLDINVGTAEFIAGMAGLAASFSPGYEEQPIPEALAPFDEEGDWE